MELSNQFFCKKNHNLLSAEPGAAEELDKVKINCGFNLRLI